MVRPLRRCQGAPECMKERGRAALSWSQSSIMALLMLENGTKVGSSGRVGKLLIGLPLQLQALPSSKAPGRNSNPDSRLWAVNCHHHCAPRETHTSLFPGSWGLRCTCSVSTDFSGRSQSVKCQQCGSQVTTSWI